jgi:hypothetical protein
MRTLAFVSLLILIAGAFASTQFRDGDIIVTNQIDLVVLDPRTARVTTLVGGLSAYAITDVTMDAANRDLLVTAYGLQGPGIVAAVNPTGIPIVRGAAAGLVPDGLALDHDGRWVVPNGQANPPALWEMDDGSGALRTLVVATGLPFLPIRDVVIDYTSPTMPLLFVTRNGLFCNADRQGRVNTLRVFGTLDLDDIELDENSGHYLLCAKRNPSTVGLADKAGVLTPVTTGIWFPRGARFARDGTAWIAAWNGVYRIDMQGRVLSVYSPVCIGASALAIYGSRQLVCQGSGAPGTSVQVRLRSRKAGDGGRPYQIACSFLRGGGIRMPNGEWLNLVPDDLFLFSTSNQAPGIFQGFSGTTDPSGEATAYIRLPASLPARLNLPVFVAGVIHDGRTIRTVTNVHAFVLN